MASVPLHCIVEPQARNALLAAYYILDEGGDMGLSREQVVEVLTAKTGVNIDQLHVSRTLKKKSTFPKSSGTIGVDAIADSRGEEGLEFYYRRESGGARVTACPLQYVLQ